MTAIDDCQMYQIELPTTVLSADSNFNHLNNTAGMQTDLNSHGLK